MADTVEGVVEKINRSEGPGGKWQKVSVNVRSNWYSGFVNKVTEDDRGKVKEGDTVKIEYVANGRYLNIEKLTVTEGYKPQAAGTTKPAEVSNGYVPQDVRELKITIASARNSAVEFVRLALEHEALSLGTKGKKVDTLFEHVNYYTEKFATQLINANSVNLLGVVEKAKPAAAEGKGDDYSE